MDINKSNVKIYCKSVFVTDEAQELIPKWLTVLQGVIDMPDLPLNVSRSYLQNEPQVKKIAQHIIKKVADSLVGEFRDQREHYAQIWPDIAPFVKYGMMNDDKFHEQVKDAVLYELAGAPGAVGAAPGAASGKRTGGRFTRRRARAGAHARILGMPERLAQKPYHCAIRTDQKDLRLLGSAGALQHAWQSSKNSNPEQSCAASCRMSW